MKLHVIAARQRLPPSILRRRARYAMASSRSGRAPPAAIPQGRGASLLARFPSTSARHPAGRATHPAPVLRLRPPPSRRGAPRPHLPDFRLRPPASPQGALHILRQFSACARRRSAGARAVRHSPDFRLRPPAIPQGRARYVIHRISACARRQPAGARCVLTCQISVYIRPPSRRGARGTSFTGFPPAPAASPQGRTARNPAGWIPAFPRATTPRTAWTVRGGIGALRLCTLHGIRAFAGICRSGVRSLRISRSGNQARIPAAVRSRRASRSGGAAAVRCPCAV